ncbi:MAG: hypothetical protein VX899_03590 [Myxococcota bacterium]|nr:hypothetical protein [Myxococcota bacterium]
MWIWMLACSDPLPRTVAACEEALPAVDPYNSYAETAAQVSPDCWSALAEGIGLPLYSPPAANTTEAHILLGLLTLLADDSQTLGEALEDPDAPELAQELLLDGAMASGVSPEDPVGWGWFSLVSAHIEHTRIVEDMEDSDHLASFSDGTVTFPEHHWAATWILGDFPLVTGAILVHEASHARVGHVPCEHQTADENDQCDDDTEGAYGVQLWMLQSWMWQHPRLRGAWECWGTESMARDVCTYRLNTRPDWRVCHQAYCTAAP